MSRVLVVAERVPCTTCRGAGQTAWFFCAPCGGSGSVEAGARPLTPTEEALLSNAAEVRTTLIGARDALQRVGAHTGRVEAALLLFEVTA